MADGFALALQAGLRAALVANSDVTALVSTRVYDEPPQTPTFPYVRFLAIEPLAFDTDTTEGSLVTVTFECHSRSASGRVEASRVAEAVKAAPVSLTLSTRVAERTDVSVGSPNDSLWLMMPPTIIPIPQPKPR